MSWNPNDKEIQGVLALNGAGRYSYWIKKAADEEKVWSLWQEGWALAADDKGRQLIPVWPHSKYAELCAEGIWSGYEPRSVSLDVWLERWIPGMEKDGRGVAVFPTPKDTGVSVEPRRLEGDLRQELSKYE